MPLSVVPVGIPGARGSAATGVQSSGSFFETATRAAVPPGLVRPPLADLAGRNLIPVAYRVSTRLANPRRNSCTLKIIGGFR